MHVVTRLFLLVTLLIYSLAYCVYNLRTKAVEESIQVIFDEKDNGILSEYFLNLSYVMMMMKKQ